MEILLVDLSSAGTNVSHYRVETKFYRRHSKRSNSVLLNSLKANIDQFPVNRLLF
jgi:hypothetical protein